MRLFYGFLHLLTMMVAGIVLLPMMIYIGIHDLWRRLELRYLYNGSEDARRKAEWSIG